MLRRCLQAWCAIVLCEALVKDVDFQMNNHLVKELEVEYGLELGGTITIDLQNRHPANDTYLMILSYGQWLQWRTTEMAPLTGVQPQAKDPFNAYLVSSWRGVLWDHLQGTFRVEECNGGRNRYTVLLVSALRSSIDVHGQLTFENPGNGQLPLQDIDVPWALGLAAGVYLVTALLLSWSLLRSTALHSLLFLVLFLRGLVMMLQWLDFFLVGLNGKESTFAEILWQLFGKVQDISELMMFLLISLGWKVLRPHLDISEIRFAVAISIISFYLGVFQVACTTPSTCSGYQLSRYILHALCYLVVIVAMNFNLQKLVSAIADAPATVESGKLYRKLQAYQIFRWVFLLFIVAPTFELFLKVTIIPWDQEWLYVLVQELRAWVIYLVLVYAYRPNPAPLRVFELTERSDGSDRED